MAQHDEGRDLKHELANAQQQKKALQHLLDKASDELEELVASDCEEAKKEQALKAAERFRTAAKL